MKGLKTMLIIILLTSLIIIGCENVNKNPYIDPVEENIDEEAEIIDDESSDDKEELEVMDDFLSMLVPDTNAADLGKYIKNNIKDVSPEDAEKMIKWLLIYQTEIIDDFNNKIYEPGYMEALNQDMNGILDESKINKISDKVIRSDYQKLVDSLLTIVRYEEHPAVETDWKELGEFSSYVSEDLREIIDLYKRIQNYEYEREDLDVSGISQDIIKTEDVLGRDPSDFIKKKANQLYNLQIYALLVGPEGSYLNMWIDKNTKEYNEIIKLKEEYPESILAELISAIDKAEIENIMDVIDIINQKQQFGLNSNNYIENLIYNKDNGEYNIIEVKIPNNKEKEASINNIIRRDVEKYVENLDIDENFNLNLFQSFEDDKYISYEGILTYYDSQENQGIMSFYRTLDYINEEFVTLEEYLNTDFNTIKNDLKKITGKNIKTTPDFLLSNMSYGGIDLFLKEVEGMEGYIHLTEKDLVPYFKNNNK